MHAIASSLLSLLKRSEPARQFKNGLFLAPDTTDSKRGQFLIGRWKGTGQNSVGCNDLNRWRLQFVGFPFHTESHSDSGFEIYLAQIHPNDIFRELDSIKQQLVAQTPSQACDIRIRNRDHTWIKVTVCRDFSYCQYNGELLRLDISVFASTPSALGAGNSQNL